MHRIFAQDSVKQYVVKVVYTPPPCKYFELIRGTLFLRFQGKTKANNTCWPICL